MPIRQSIWKVGDRPQPLAEARLASEQQLEQMIVASPSLLSEDIMLIGRQEETGFGGRIDLLAVNPDGTLVLIELKRDRTPREVVEFVRIGTDVAVSSGTANGATGVPGPSVPLIVGEVTAIEGLIEGLTAKTVVRGYTAAHRLQRARRSRSFLNVTDADVARQLAAEVGLAIGNVVPTSTTHAGPCRVAATT